MVSYRDNSRTCEITLKESITSIYKPKITSIWDYLLKQTCHRSIDFSFACREAVASLLFFSVSSASFSLDAILLWFTT